MLMTLIMMHAGQCSRGHADCSTGLVRFHDVAARRATFRAGTVGNSGRHCRMVDAAELSRTPDHWYVLRHL
jgi:hypothetical protein